MTTSPTADPKHCDLCEAARLTPWYHEDDLCWIAECEFCSVPMVVLREHQADPPAGVKAQLRARLEAVVSEHFGFDHWVDDNMRNIPDHYHAHARRRGGIFGTGSASAIHSTSTQIDKKGVDVDDSTTSGRKT